MHTVEIVRLEGAKRVHEKGENEFSHTLCLFILKPVCVSVSLILFYSFGVEFCQELRRRANNTQHILRHTHVQYTHSHRPLSILCSFLLLA